MGGRIKEQRMKMGMTQEQLAEQMNTTKAAISQYENNKIDIAWGGKAGGEVEVSVIV